MPDQENAARTCPLCLAADEVQSMVTVEIDRSVPRGRVAIMICRSCAGAMIRAVRKLEPPLLTPGFWIDEVKSDQAAEGESTKPNGEKDDDPYTD